MPNYSNILIQEENVVKKEKEKKKEEKKVEIKKILPKNILNNRYCHFIIEEEEEE